MFFRNSFISRMNGVWHYDASSFLWTRGHWSLVKFGWKRFDMFFKFWFPLFFLLFCESRGCPEECLCFKTVTRCIFQRISNIPPEIPSTTTVLDLRFNSIRRIRSGAFRNLRYLHTLLLNNNQLETIDGGAFDGLINLKSLYIYRNKLKELKPGMFHGLPSMENLYAHVNDISSIHPDTFLDAPNLIR